MSTRATIAGHPIHPMLVTIPIGLWIFTLTSDIVFAVTGDASWATTAFYTLAGGLAGALLAAAPGLLDVLRLREAHEQRVGMIHMILNLAIVVVQAVNFALRATSPAPAETNATLALSALAVAALIVSGWLGGELVHVFGVTQPERHGEASRAAGYDRAHHHT